MIRKAVGLLGAGIGGAWLALSPLTFVLLVLAALPFAVSWQAGLCFYGFLAMWYLPDWSGKRKARRAHARPH